MSSTETHGEQVARARAYGLPLNWVRSRAMSQPVAVVAITVIVLIVVQLSSSSVWITIVTDVALAAIPAMALSVLLGWAGQAVLFSAALLLIGGYCAVIVPATWPGSLLIALLCAGAAGAGFGLIAALPSWRLAGVYLLLSSMALQFIVGDVANYVQSSTGNTGGYSPLPPNLFGLRVETPNQWLWAAGIALLLVYLYFRHLRRTRIGRALIVIHDDLSAARIAGVRTNRQLIWIFMITSAVTSAAGALSGYYNELVTYQGLDVFASISFFVMVVLGVPGSLPGAILGAAFVTALPQVLPLFGGNVQSTSLTYIEQLIYAGVALSFLLIKRRDLRRLLGNRGRPWSGPGGGAKVMAEGVEAEAMPGAARNTPDGAEPADVAPTSTLLRLSNVTVCYDSAVGVTDVSFDVAMGQTVALVGPNGAGKTSTLAAIVGSLPGNTARVSAGSIQLAADSGISSLNRLSAEARGQLGVVFVPAEDKVFNELTVDDHLELVRPREMRPQEARRRREELFDVFPDLPPLGQRRAGLLSGGERQQLALMCALIRAPRLLVADELSLGLSPAAIERLVAALQRVRETGKVSIVLAEQNTTVALACSDWVVAMSSHRIRAQGPPSAALEKRLRQAYVGTGIEAEVPVL